MDIYQKVLELNDRQTEIGLRLQVKDSASKYFGGIMDPETGIPRANHVGSASYVPTWAASLFNEDSSYYLQEQLLQSLEHLVDFMLRRQHPDGTITLGSTNYNSPPDTGFVVVGLAQAYQWIEKQEWDKKAKLSSGVRQFLERTIPAMLTGGCHTPNHRWVMTAALASLHDIFGLSELVARAEEWLAEGLDCTEDGEWTERSNGIYNTVNDIMLYRTAELLDKPELLEPVRKNLRMMAYMIHPSGEVVTDYSGRQDYGQETGLDPYFLICRLMAAHDRDPLFASMSDAAAASLRDAGSTPNHTMLNFLLYPELRLDNLERAELPKDYEKVINEHHPATEHLRLAEKVGHHSKVLHSDIHTAFGSPVVRYRKGKTSATLMTRTPSLFSLRHGRVRLLGTKVTTAFTPGIVTFDEFQKLPGGYRFSTTMEKGYNGPIPKKHLPDYAKQGTSPWYLLPHQHRPVTHLQTHRLQARVVPHPDRWTLQLESDEREDVFTQVTFIFDRRTKLSGNGLQPAGDDHWFLAEGSMVAEDGGDRMEISPGVHEHFLPVLRNDHHPAGFRCVSLNLMTPFNITIEISLSTT